MSGQARKVIVRPASLDEAGLMLDIMVRCWTGTVAGDSSAYRETAEKIAEDLRAGHGVFVEVDGEIVGCGRFVAVPGPAGERNWAELKRVGVLREHRKLGLAAPMVAALEKEAARRGYPGAQLGVRHDQNRLTTFWASLGYTLADDVRLSNPNPLTPPAVHMRKRFALPG